jgi:hypothetical protein
MVAWSSVISSSALPWPLTWAVIVSGPLCSTCAPTKPAERERREADRQRGPPAEALEPRPRALRLRHGRRGLGLDHGHDPVLERRRRRARLDRRGQRVDRDLERLGVLLAHRAPGEVAAEALGLVLGQRAQQPGAH